MYNKISSTLCACLLVLGATSSANADTVNVLFSNNSGDTVNYSFTTIATEFTEDGSTFTEWSETFDSAVFNVGGTTTGFLSSAYNLQLGTEFTSAVFDVFELNTESNLNPVVRMRFNGEFYFDNGQVNAIVFGQEHIGDFSLNASPLLDMAGASIVDSNGELAFDSVTVTTTVSAVPVPAAVWLFGSGLIGLVGVARRRTV